MRYLLSDIYLMIILILQPFFLYSAFKVGKGEKLFFEKKTTEERKITEKEKQAIKEWKNIFNYSGDSEGQEEIN